MTLNQSIRHPFQDVTNASSSRNSKDVKVLTKPFARQPKTNIVTNIRNKRPGTSDVFPKPKKICISHSISLDSKVQPKRVPTSSSKYVVDIDLSEDPLDVTEYAQDIYNHLKKQEIGACVNPSYMDEQESIDQGMRTVLVDWLIEVQRAYEFQTETLYLAVNLIDRVLAKVPCSKGSLQLIGITCMFLASKYEEIYHLSVDQIVAICAHFYTEDQIYSTEVTILQALNYQISFPTANSFLPRYLKAAEANNRITSIAHYVLATTLLSHKLLQYRPSQLASAAIFIARKHSSQPWTPTLIHYTGYDMESILPVARTVLEELSAMPENVQSVHKAFKTGKNLFESSMKFKSTI